MAVSSNAIYFAADLRTPRGVEPGELIPFHDLEAACCDIYAAIPHTAAQLLRDGVDPMACAYLVRDEEDRLLVEISFAELLNRKITLADGGDRHWRSVNADLQRRSDEASHRLDRATAWMSRLAARASAVGTRAF